MVTQLSVVTGPPGVLAAGHGGARLAAAESLRLDYSQYFLGLRLNFFVATGMTLAGLAWFTYTQRRTTTPGQPPPEDDTLTHETEPATATPQPPPST